MTKKLKTKNENVATLRRQMLCGPRQTRGGRYHDRRFNNSHLNIEIYFVALQLQRYIHQLLNNKEVQNARNSYQQLNLIVEFFAHRILSIKVRSKMKSIQGCFSVVYTL